MAGAGRKWVTPGLILQARARADGEARVGFTVSRRVGGAVARNRVRRRLRAAADRVLPVHAMPGHDLVIIGRATSLGRRFAALLGDLKTALQRLDAYRDGNGEGPEARRARTP